MEVGSMPFPFPAEEAGSTHYFRQDGRGFQEDMSLSPLSRPDSKLIAADDSETLNGRLQEITSLPKISGAAIALDLGDALECRASFGQSAPPIGTRCHPGSGLTGACLATSEIQLCNNVDEDSRVNRQACQQLGVRSVLVVPIKDGAKVRGVLEAMSTETDAFDEETLGYVTGFAEGLLSRSSQCSLTLDSYDHDGKPCEHPASTLPLVPTQPSTFGLQELLAAAYVIHQHQRATDLETNPVLDGGNIDERDDDAGMPKAPNLTDQLSAAPSPNFSTFGEEFSAEGLYRSLTIGAILLGLLFCAYFLVHGDKASRLKQAVKISESAAESGGAPPAGKPDLVDGVPQLHSAMTNSVAPYSLATRRAAGNSAPRTYAAAMGLFEEAAKKGDAEAAWKVALGYLRGIGVPRDEIKGAAWLKKAANLGDVRAQTALSDLYFTGDGVPRDYMRSYTWANIAAHNGQAADGRLELLKQRMTTAQLEDANRRIAAWFAQKPKQ